MKKGILVIMLCLVCAFLTACASSTADTGAVAPTAAPLAVDLDLSKLSGTVVYSQVYNMMYEPETYIGKVTGWPVITARMRIRSGTSFIMLV